MLALAEADLETTPDKMRRQSEEYSRSHLAGKLHNINPFYRV